MTVEIYFAVFLDGNTQAIAIFAYGDQAQKWAAENYPDKPCRIRRCIPSAVELLDLE